MPFTLMIALFATMIGTAFLSGIFGMAGGMILIGVLLALLPVPAAMALHAITQMASNGWRAFLWRNHIRWRAAGYFLIGSTLAFVVWSFWLYVPSTPIALILLGLTPFLARAAPAGLKPNPARLAHGVLYGSVCMSLMLLTGVTGPLIDTFFLGGGNFGRREIVATKAICQTVSHTAKLFYFGGLVAGGAAVDLPMALLAVIASMLGTSLARPVLERLSDGQYRQWAAHIITAIALTYLAHGSFLLLWPRS
jgi:uncharacterized membrane protein YfcA